jgi:hypothetical protein
LILSPILFHFYPYYCILFVIFGSFSENGRTLNTPRPWISQLILSPNFILFLSILLYFISNFCHFWIIFREWQDPEFTKTLDITMDIKHHFYFYFFLFFRDFIWNISILGMFRIWTTLNPPPPPGGAAANVPNSEHHWESMGYVLYSSLQLLGQLTNG